MVINLSASSFAGEKASISTTDTDSDGTVDDLDTEDDNDGLSDTYEATQGTDPLNSDSDDDGVTDGQEITDSTNPLDKGSYLAVLSTDC